MNEQEIPRDPGLPSSTAGTPPEEPLSRRRLVLGGLAAVGVVAVSAAAAGRAATAVAAQQPLSDNVVVTDPTLCVGCLACEVNCSTWHASVGRSAVARIRILATPEVKLQTTLASYLPDRSGFSPSTCRQCPTPWCVPNCPTDALRVDQTTGDRYISETECIDCGKCEVDCPVEWKGTLARTSLPIDGKRVVRDPVNNVYVKCDLCIGRQGGPICVERCPVNVAIRAGYIRSDHLALDLKPSTQEQWEGLV